MVVPSSQQSSNDIVTIPTMSTSLKSSYDSSSIAATTTTCAPFTELDNQCINTIRMLAADMVQHANSGHPGAPMGLAPTAHVLFSRFLRINPKDPHWINRDRFVLSNGHACALQYIMLHLLGYPGMSMDELKAFRALNSHTPGHPESHITQGIECTTGPLGQGVANGVGMAIAEAHLFATTNYHHPMADNTTQSITSSSSSSSSSLIDHFTYVILGDGCMMEGISSEACSLAGHLGLGKLICIYDDNHISIDGSTSLAFTENVNMRFEAYGWHCQRVENGDVDLDAIAKAIEAAQLVTDRPSLISIRTTIGYGSKNQGTEKVHGAPLGGDDVIQVRKRLGMTEYAPFSIPMEVKKFYEEVAQRGQFLVETWINHFKAFCNTFPEKGADLQRRLSGKLPSDASLLAAFPRYAINNGEKPTEMATRKLSELVLNAIAPNLLPELIGGSADLTHSNLTKWKDSEDFQRSSNGIRGNNASPLTPSAPGSYHGRYLRFGVREHAMFAICNGIAAAYSNVLIPFASTFLNFISYGLGAVRLSALSHLQVIYLMTHDSIGLGEDGPTHQPVETLASLRAIPNLLVIRPADGNEVSGAYWIALHERTRPTVICLSRQNVPVALYHDAECNEQVSFEGVSRGAYIVKNNKTNLPSIILVGSGSEVNLCLEAAKVLEGENRENVMFPLGSVRVVSMPSWELFEEQSAFYKKSIFEAIVAKEGVSTTIPVLSVEAASPLGWSQYAHASVAMRSFGASGPFKKVYEKFGFTPSAIAEKAIKLVNKNVKHPLPSLPLFLEED